VGLFFELVSGQLSPCSCLAQVGRDLVVTRDSQLPPVTELHRSWQDFVGPFKEGSPEFVRLSLMDTGICKHQIMYSGYCRYLTRAKL
jgi:hypothetical protein